jgi:tagaturonate reductase
MRLCKDVLQKLENNNTPTDALPERVLQFGTGVLLRALPDYFIDKANKAGFFNGRIVVVKSTDKGDASAFAAQDNLYTHCIQGVNEETFIVNSSISRVLSAATEWAQILACAANEDLQIIISNTTEAGLILKEDDDISGNPPASFPGKLLAFLQERYRQKKKGLVIIPTELIPHNGTLLKDIILQLASQQERDKGFLQWLREENTFCNSLVDRIVPGASASVASKLPYEDELLVTSESYCLWAIETDRPEVKDLLSFHLADSSVVIAQDISAHRELKLRLLNGTHTLSCGLACLAGFDTVKDAMANPAMEMFITSLMVAEIIPAITSVQIREDAALRFAHAVRERFRNPHIDHRWSSIAQQYTPKMKTRVLPILEKHYQRSNEAPALIALGFAAYHLYATDAMDIPDYPGFAQTVLALKQALINEGAGALINRLATEITNI